MPMVTVCLRKRNGNTHAVEGRPRPLIRGIISLPVWQTSMGLSHTPAIPRESIVRGQRMLEVSRLIPGVCTTCMGMYGNGVGTGTAATRAERPWTPGAQLRGLTVWSGEGVGTVRRGAPVPQTGTMVLPLIGSITWVSAWFSHSFSTPGDRHQ